MTEPPTVVVSEPLAAPAEGWLRDRCRIVYARPDRDSLARSLADADGLAVRSATRVDGDVIAAAPRLRVVGRAGVGLERIDVAACRRRGVEVVYTPDANTQAVAEFVLAVISLYFRPQTTLREAVSLEEWERLREAGAARRQLDELTLGVLGFGRIGRRLARIAGAIGMRVLFNDLLDVPPPERGSAAPVAVEALFAKSDVVSVHVDGRSSNRGFVGSRLLGRLGEQALLINTSRGFVVDNVALAESLRQRPGTHAYLDVHEPEPFGSDHPLREMPNATLTPHMASRTETAVRAMSWVVRDVVAVLEGRSPRLPAPTLE